MAFVTFAMEVTERTRRRICRTVANRSPGAELMPRGYSRAELKLRSYKRRPR
jgi:hypothetical protein